MEKGLSFARKINFAPLLTSIFFGIIISTIVYSIFPQYPVIWIICGVLAFMIESMLIYPKHFNNTYGYWKIDDQGIHYYDYSTWQKRLYAIYFPLLEKPVEVPYSAIKTFSLIDGKSIMNTRYPLGGVLNTPQARKIHYLVIQTNQRKVKLSCAWKSSGIPTTSADIQKVNNFLNRKCK